MNIDKIRATILSERKRLGYTQQYMAQALVISENSYRDIENGKTSLINKRLPSIAKILNLSLDELVLGYTPPSEETAQKIHEIEKEYQRKVTLLECQYQLIIAEKNGEIHELKASLESKLSIIGILKERIPNY